jgi:hypothetical protein
MIPKSLAIGRAALCGPPVVIPYDTESNQTPWAIAQRERTSTSNHAMLQTNTGMAFDVGTHRASSAPNLGTRLIVEV